MEFRQIEPWVAFVLLFTTLSFFPESVTATLEGLPQAGLEALASDGPLKAFVENSIKSELGGLSDLTKTLTGENPLDMLSGDFGSLPKKMEQSMISPMLGGMPGVPLPGHKKMMKKTVPLKKVAIKKGALKKGALKKGIAAKTLVPKVKIPMALKAKPKVHSLKPIVHIVEKPVKVYHKVPVPKKVLVPKFYPVYKPIPVPKIVPVPFKVPIKKIVPKIVKVPKAIPVPKFVPIKKHIPIGIPYPVPKVVKVPIPKPVPYKKFIPIPVPKKVPKFVPFPVKKIIKVPKPYYVPIKVPHITTSYIKTPMKVQVPDIKKLPMKGFPDKFGGFMKKEDSKDGFPFEQDGFNFIPNEDKGLGALKFEESNPLKELGQLL